MPNSNETTKNSAMRNITVKLGGFYLFMFAMIFVSKLFLGDAYNEYNVKAGAFLASIGLFSLIFGYRNLSYALEGIYVTMFKYPFNGLYDDLKSILTRTSSSKNEVLSKRLLGLAEILRFFLPHKVRETIYEPYEQELKEDFLLAASKPHSVTGKFFIWSGFYFRLTVAFFQSLTCWLLGAFPSLFKALLGIGGTPK